MTSEEHREREQVVDTGDYVQRKRVVESAPPTSQVLLARARRLIWLIAGIIIGLIAFRFVLLLIGTDRGASAFGDFVYGVSDLFVWPFYGITGTPTFGQGSVIDVASLFAMVVYPLIAWAVIRLLYILFKAPPGATHISTYERQ